MWNFQECIRYGVEYPGVTTKKPHRVSRGPLFRYWNFQGCNIFLWNCCNHELWFFQNFKHRPRKFDGLFTKAFPQPHSLSFFFLEQTTDRETDLLAWVLRSPAYCNALEPLPEFPQNNICYRLQPKYTSFSCFSTICSFAIWKFLYLQNRSYLHHFWYLEGSWPNIIARFYWQNLLCADYSLVHIMKV